MIATSALLVSLLPQGHLPQDPLLDSDRATASQGSVELEYKTFRKWDIVLPAEQFARVSGGFSVAHCTGDSFAAKLDGTALLVDTDGDGEPDVRVTGREDETGKRSGLVTFEGKDAEGAPFKYTARLVDSGTGWHFAASGARVGKLGETRIQLIDQNNDGRYDGFGEDAMIVGRSKYATFLSRAINVGGELFSIEVSPDGARIDYAPFTGEVGVLDLASGMDTKAKLLSAIVRSTGGQDGGQEGGQYSFDLARAKEGLKVPATVYALQSGKLGLGKAATYVRPGRLADISVASGQHTALDWGGPIQAEFHFDRAGADLRISPDDVTYFGRAGEEYKVWDPVGKSPEFTVKEVKAGTELAKAMFPGSS